MTDKRTAEDIASELLECRRAIADWKAIEKPLTESLKARIKAGEAQSHFKITTAATFKIDNLKKALKWAQKFAPNTITVDATSARKIFLGDVATGSMGSAEKNGFMFKETEKLVMVGESEE